MQKLTIAEAKQRLRIQDLWHHLGLSGKPAKSCKCPFHDDHAHSFSVSTDGLLWNCFAGCGGGDAVNFLERALGLSAADACRELLRLGAGELPRASQTNRRSAGPLLPRAPRTVEPPAMHTGNECDHRTLAALRRVSIQAVDLAVRRGLIRFGVYQGQSAWLVCDSTRRNIQARRMDGRLWQQIGTKAWTLRGSNAGWPIGAKEATSFPFVALCEGGPDLLAAFHFICLEGRQDDCAAVAMLGAALRIPAEALPLFAGKSVRIFGHDDSTKLHAGARAVERWNVQLTGAGATVDAFSFAGLQKPDGTLAKDLNDLTDNRHELPSVLP